MSSLTVSSVNQSGFQQLSALTAKRNADQAEQMAQALRKQADAVQAQADQYAAKAQALDSQASKAKVDSDAAHLRLNLSNAFQDAGAQLTKTIQNAEVRPSTYSQTVAGITTTSAADDNKAVGSSIDIVA
ncbi:hypothetical protein ACH5Y9_03850 [Methylomonas sp. BW4-1]|uniref:Uncharacterized protein n=1 Tax=Methylomonas defluvii TaxID=3045149 RepID=A0ABU4ULB4_9GAMM|nr:MULTISPECIES: hypothetical protein [unclassified Methylomonas]MDX8130297.1 hypothetical protein [Methylomonas sp. OY6]PKD37935.1 hypothetical protein CWO84_22030 [Methylomonas sp. Kb3]QBC28313.1 hypothetical protein U737_16220 [Methylomonas sp. LW13]